MRSTAPTDTVAVLVTTSRVLADDQQDSRSKAWIWATSIAVVVLLFISVVSASNDGSANPAAAAPDVLLGQAKDWLLSNLSKGVVGLVGVFGGFIGYVGKKMADDWTARTAGQREFVKEVTKQISTLAEKHYWGLANGAGVLAGQLEGYLALRTYHLILIWRRPADLRARLDEIATEASRDSFPHFCRLIWLFDKFQFQGSTTYLLTSQASGDHCKRLYNMFIGSLPDKLPLANIREMEIEIDEDGTKRKRKLRDLPSGALTGEQIREHLPELEKTYRDWLTNNVPDVGAAANALRAYSELLNHELARLYQYWFKRRVAVGVDEELARARWPNVLTEQSVVTLSIAGYESSLLRPLGAAMTSARRGAPVTPGESKGTGDERIPPPNAGEGTVAVPGLTPPGSA